MTQMHNSDKITNIKKFYRHRLIGLKNTFCALLLGIVAFVLILDVFKPEELRGDNFFWLLASASSAICTIIVTFTLRRIWSYLKANNIENNIAVNSIYFEIISEFFILFGECCGLIVYAMQLYDTNAVSHRDIITIFRVVHFIAAPCALLAFFMIMHRLLSRLKSDQAKSNYDD